MIEMCFRMMSIAEDNNWVIYHYSEESHSIEATTDGTFHAKRKDNYLNGIYNNMTNWLLL